MQSLPEAENIASGQRRVFVIGCGRSGTTWMQLLLAQHPGVATTGETRLYSRYIRQLDQAWRDDKATMDGTGLCHVLTDEQFASCCSRFANRVFDNILLNNPDAAVVAEKTPSHALHGPLILKSIPDAFFLHIVRDPRGVVGSLRAASRSFGRDWAPRSVAAGARMWSDTVEAARDIGRQTHHYKEVRYEDLLGSDGVKRLGEIFDWLGLDSNQARCERVMQSCKIDNLRKKDSGVRENRTHPGTRPVFFRKGRADSWRQELSHGDLRIIEYIASDLMRTYHYYPELTKAPRKPARLWIHNILEGLEWRVNKKVQAAFSRARSIT